MWLDDCHNVEDFHRLAKQRLPGPIFHHIDGARGKSTSIHSIHSITSAAASVFEARYLRRRKSFRLGDSAVIIFASRGERRVQPKR